MSLSMQFILVSDVEVSFKNFLQVAKNQFFDFSWNSIISFTGFFRN